MLQQKMMVTVNNTCSSVSHDNVDGTLVLIMMLPLIINLVQVKTENLDKQVKFPKLKIKPGIKDSDYQ